jgi:putative FmdB family regulatory protein
MPIYAYRCADCGHAKDVLQKISDPPLTVCPACGAQRFEKQVTAAGFQLKGSGWYVTDFRNNSGGKSEKSTDKAGEKAGDKTGDKAGEASAEKPATAPAASGDAAAPAASPAPATASAAAPAPSSTP